MKRNTIILTGLLAALAVAAYVVMQRPGEQSLSAERANRLWELDSLSVDRIEIRTPSTSVALEKRGAEWFLTTPVNSKAEQPTVGSIIQQSKNLEVSSIVSSKPEKQSVFQVDSTGTLVKIYEKGTEKASFVIGKVSSSYGETYVRKPNSNDVVLVNGVFGYMFNRPVKDWRDKTILTIPKETVKEVKFQYGDTTFTLALKDSVWIIGRDSTQDAAVQSLITGLVFLKTDDFMDSVLSPAPKITAQISYAGVQLRFAFIKDGNKYFVQSSNSPQWFVLDSWHANQLLKRKKELIKARK